MKLSDCKHEWNTKYTSRFYADGVEWFCIRCHETLPWPEAKRRVNEYAWMRREIERVGRALFTGTKSGYVGTEEDLHAIGQFVEGVCETAVYNEGLMSVEAENAELKRENEGHVDVLERIVNWSKAYPIDVFPEPDLKKAHEILKANGMTLDAISASSMRHVVAGVGKMAKDALLTAEEQDASPS